MPPGLLAAFDACRASQQLNDRMKRHAFSWTHLMSAFGGKADMACGHREGLFIYLPTTNMCLGGGGHLSNFFRSNRRPWRRQGYGYVPDKSDHAKNKYWDCDDDWLRPQ